MVYCDIVANSKNAGPHSVVCLLFSFQRPSFETSTRSAVASSQALTVAEVAKTTVLRQEEVDLRPSPGTVKKVRRGLLPPSSLPNCGVRLLPRTSLLRQEGFTGTVSASASLLGGGCFYSRPGAPSRRKPERCFDFFRLLRRFGALLLTPGGRPRQLRSPVERSARNRRASSARARDLLSCPGGVKHGRHRTVTPPDQRPSQRARSSSPRRSRRATAVADALSAAPPSRARSCATIASRSCWAASSASFTSA
jgi:hypothetical protein